MKIRLFILVKLIARKSPFGDPVNGALVRFYKPGDKDPHLDFIPDFENALHNGTLEPGAYELIQSGDVYGVDNVVRRLSSREKKWVEKNLNIPEDIGAYVEMCTLDAQGHNGKCDLRFHNESATLISVYDLHDRVGPIPRESGICTMIFLPQTNDTVLRRIVKPIYLKKPPAHS